MSLRACCELRDGDGARAGGPRSRWLGRRGARASGWVVPGLVMVLMPKCPACLVAYVAVITGMGISVSVAAGLRWMALGLCGVLIGYFVVTGLMRWVRA